jgi:phage terminase Nu1 subunit (DNA packaging protein)
LFYFEVRHMTVVPVPEIARIFDVTPKTVHAWIREGLPVVSAGKPGRGNAAKVDVREAVRWVMHSRGGQAALTEARTDLARAQAEKLHDERLKRRGDMVSVATTGRVWGELLREISTNLCALNDRGVVEAGLNAEQSAWLESSCEALLGRLRAWKPGG